MQIVPGFANSRIEKKFPTVLQWAKMQTSFGSLCAPTVLLLGCVLVYIYTYGYGYGYAAKDRLLVFSWANQQILERTLTSPMIPKQSEAARLQRLQTWICLCNTWWHILPSVAKKASTTSTAKSTAAVAGQSHPLSSCWLSKSSGRSVFELESCHRLIELSTVSLSLQYTEI